MLCFDDFIKKDYVVSCKTGVFANAKNGRRMIYDEESSKYCEAPLSSGSKYVLKRTAHPYYTSGFLVVNEDKKIVFYVAKAEKIDKHGLEWECIFEAEFVRYEKTPIETGKGSSHFWLVGEGAGLITPDLLEHKNFNKLSIDECIEIFVPKAKRDVVISEIKYSGYDGIDKFTFFIHMWLGINKTKLINGFHSMKDLKFGLELEFTGMTRADAAKVISDYIGSQVKHYRSYDAYVVKDRLNRDWKIVKDASIKPQEKNSFLEPGETFKCELVTPVCKYDEIPYIQELIRKLRRAGMITNDSCGIHVHVDGSSQTARSLYHLSNVMSKMEPTLFKALNTNTIRQEKWCRKADPVFIHLINNSKNSTIDYIKKAWYWKEDPGLHYNQTRYHALNLHSLWEGKGIEFRMFNSTTHAGKVKAYIQLCLAITAKVVSANYDSRFYQETEFTEESFKYWLLYLGLVGSEFKTARLHLLSNFKEDTLERTNAA